MLSCQKAGFEDEMYPVTKFMNAALKPSENAIVYGAETFRIVSKDDPFLATRILTNPDYKYFEKFMLKGKWNQQQGCKAGNQYEGFSVRCKKIEIDFARLQSSFPNFY